MDPSFECKFRSNVRCFQRDVERIAEKYCKLQYEDDTTEVDLNSTNLDTLEKYLTIAKKNVDKLESMRFADLGEESFQDITRDSELDFKCKEASDDFETTNLSEVIQNDATRQSVTGPLEESQSNYSLVSEQPEDQDADLEMSLQSQGSSLGEHYPDMVSRIGKAWRRQHVTEAADFVRRRYKRWHKPVRIHPTNTSHIVHRRNKETSRRELFSKHHHASKIHKESASSTVTKAVSQSPLKTAMIIGQKSQYHCSPVRRSEAPIVVMDMPAIYEKPESALNQTFTVSEPSLLFSSFPSSPQSFKCSPNKPRQDFSFRMKESPRHMQSAGSSVLGSTVLKEIHFSPVRTSPYKAKFTSENCFNEQNNIYGSPIRKSPFKLHTSRGRESPRQSRFTHVSSPSSPHMKNFCKDLKRFNSASNFVQSSKYTVPRRTLEYPDERLSFLQLSPQLTKPKRQHHGIKRHYSFDSSSLPLTCPSYSSKEFDDYFVKLYHKLVCLNKTSLKGHPCRFCTKNSEASRGHSSSNLEALALSPHRPLLRKRLGDFQSYIHSKRFRNGHV